MATRIEFESSSDIGVFAKLTNAYCITGVGRSENFISHFESELQDHIPVLHATIGGCRLVGRTTVGNRRGLLLPCTTSDQELQHIRNSLPESVVVQRIEERLSALGNNIVTNDHVAFVHPDIDPETEDIVADVLGVETFRQTIGPYPLVGTYCQITNQGGLVHPKCSEEEMQEISNLLHVPIVAGTVNRGCNVIGAGMVVNDWTAFVGRDTTSTELNVIESIFRLNSTTTGEGLTSQNIVKDLRSSLIDTLG